MPLFATARFPISTGGFRRGAAEDSPRPHGAPQPALRGGPTQPPPSSFSRAAPRELRQHKHRYFATVLLCLNPREEQHLVRCSPAWAEAERQPHIGLGVRMGHCPPPSYCRTPPPPHRGTLRFSGTVYERGGGGRGNRNSNNR